MLLYTMGEEAEETLVSTKISDEKKDYAKVIAKLDSFQFLREAGLTDVKNKTSLQSSS